MAAPDGGTTVAPQWCAIQKVCYRVGQDMNDLKKLEAAVDKFEIFRAKLVLNEDISPNVEWLKVESNGNLLPLRHPKTGQPLFLLMQPTGGEALAIKPPDQVLMGYIPEDLELPIFPGEAPPGGKWRDAYYCGIVTVVMAGCPCCWICLLGMGRGGPVDIIKVYDGPDGNTYNQHGKLCGPTPGNVQKPDQENML